MTTDALDLKQRRLLRPVVVGSGLLILASLVRLIPAWYLNSVVADLATYRDQAYIIIRGDNIYLRPTSFPYTPYSQFMPAFALGLSELTGWRFSFCMKLPSIVADLIGTLMVYAFLLWKKVPLSKAGLWTLFWVLNPVSILITAFHGNLITILPWLFGGAFIAGEVAQVSPNRRILVTISALLLGMAIAMRSFPVLLLPMFLVLVARNYREALEFILLASLATLLSCLPYLFYSPKLLFREMLSYSGFTEFGWVSVIRSMSPLYGGRRLFSMDPALVEISKTLFLTTYAMAVLMLPYFRRERLGCSLLLPALLFYGLYGGISAQYLIWVLPLSVLLRERPSLLYTGLSTVALVTYYSIYFPPILFGQYPHLISDNRFVVFINALSNTVLVVFCLIWAVQIVFGEVRSWRRNEATRTGASFRWFEYPWIRRVQVGCLIILSFLWLHTFWQAAVRAEYVLKHDMLSMSWGTDVKGDDTSAMLGVI